MEKYLAFLSHAQVMPMQRRKTAGGTLKSNMAAKRAP